MTETEAIEIARKYGLEHEVSYEMSVNGLTPEQALDEWDVLE